MTDKLLFSIHLEQVLCMKPSYGGRMLWFASATCLSARGASSRPPRPMPGALCLLPAGSVRGSLRGCWRPYVVAASVALMPASLLPLYFATRTLSSRTSPHAGSHVDAVPPGTEHPLWTRRGSHSDFKRAPHFGPKEGNSEPEKRARLPTSAPAETVSVPVMAVLATG